jgi:hypothetical protein
MQSARACMSALAVVAAFAAGCGAQTNGRTATRVASHDTLLVRDITPANGARNVDPSAPITIAFNHSMMTGMEMLIAVREGAVNGPAVAGTSTWSSDRTALTFTPASPLKSKTTYVVHMSPNLTDATGDTVNFAACANALGGQSVRSSMMGGSYGMMGSSNGMMGRSYGMMGSGWQAGSGMWGYGMMLTFTTR